MVEKVHIVWSGGYQTPRLKTHVYKICTVVLLGYVVIVVLSLLGRATQLRVDGECMLSYKCFVLISLVVYEALQSALFTVMFLWPLWRAHIMSPRLRAMAKRTLVGAITTLMLAAINTMVLLILDGTELAWVCMNVCATEVTLCALVLYWVSAGSPSDSVDHFTLPEINMTNLTVGDQWITSAKLNSTHMTGSTPSQTASRSSNYCASKSFGHQTFRGSPKVREYGNHDNITIVQGSVEKSVRETPATVFRANRSFLFVTFRFRGDKSTSLRYVRSRNIQ
ncbi:hypothetical protein VNI00_013700 [Paramarasmius palmivorus]|uniref:Transmembrane protein n=1 Tax=Paramarasmius palmivorus TaxID=297713 RepID=A0AAW0BVJ7_9AGAR